MKGMGCGKRDFAVLTGPTGSLDESRFGSVTQGVLTLLKSGM